MLYDYKFTLAQMSQIKNYKKNNNFDHILLDVDNVALSKYEINCTVSYKQTVPLNMFEKHFVRLIEKAIEIGVDMTRAKIATLLHLDENLVKDNLENLAAIGMLNGVNRDSITINRDSISTYLQYENKFKIESVQKNYHLAQNEYKNIDNYISAEFEKSPDHQDKKFKDYQVVSEKSSTVNVNVLSYSDNQFLIYNKNIINSENDLKLMGENTFKNLGSLSNIPKNVLCHYEEFLPILRDMITVNIDDVIVIGSKLIDEKNLEVLKTVKRLDNIYLLSSSEIEHSRMFDVGILDDFVWIGNTFYTRQEEFIVQLRNSEVCQIIKEHLKQYFIKKTVEVESSYDAEKVAHLDEQITTIQLKIEESRFQTKKKFDEAIREVNAKKNKLYGLTGKNLHPKRQKIDKMDIDNDHEALRQYPQYIENKVKIFAYKEDALQLKKESGELQDYLYQLNGLNNTKSKFSLKKNKAKVKKLQQELQTVERLDV